MLNLYRIDLELLPCQLRSPSIWRFLTARPRGRLFITNMHLEKHILFTYVHEKNILFLPNFKLVTFLLYRSRMLNQGPQKILWDPQEKIFNWGSMALVW